MKYNEFITNRYHTGNNITPNKEIELFEKLLKIAALKEKKVIFCKLYSCYGIVEENCIGLEIGMSMEKINYTLAHELAHIYLHYDKGNTILNCSEELEVQAERTTDMLMDILNM